MAEDQEIDHEPSIEEILNSIRQIISDDDVEAEPVADLSVSANDDEVREGGADLSASDDEITHEESDDFIELTEKVEVTMEDVVSLDEVEDDESLEPIEIDMLDSGIDDNIGAAVDLSTGDDDIQNIESADLAQEEDDYMDIVNSAESSVGEIISNKAEDIAASAFSVLAQKAAVDKSGSVTVEDIVREEIRPMLRSWIDGHLSGIVERLLQEELERISKRAMEE